VGIAFLGEPRSPEASVAHECGGLLWGPAVLLAAACVTLALFPGSVVRLAAPVAGQVLGPGSRVRAPSSRRPARMSPIGVAAALGWWLSSWERGS
jgi:hypothetical protein